MNKFSFLFVLLVITLFCSNSVKAQYTKLYDFMGGAAFTGASPQIDQNFISDGTYLYGMTDVGGANNLGIVFKIKISDNTYTKIMDFASAANGSFPYGSLISDGTYLYGMTYGGGANGLGTAFKIKISDNTYTKLMDFAGTANGGHPNGSLFSDGTYLYGMAQGGGANGWGTAFKIKISDNTYTKILDFAGTVNGGSPLGSLISDGTYLYGMTYAGGANNQGTAFKIKISDNTYTKILDFASAANGSFPYGSLISDGTYLYGMTLIGGTNSLGTAFKIKISDNTYTKLMDFAGVTNGSYPNGSLFSDGTYLYGMAQGGGANGWGTTFKIKISDNTYTKILDFAGTAGGSPFGSFISDGTYLYGMTYAGGANNQGTAFKIKISDNSYTKIWNFGGAPYGSNPFGSLISDGTYLYGMAQGGGMNGMGTAFKIKISDNLYTKILDFAGIANGSNSTGSFISDGTYLYGMAQTGGANSGGTAFKIKISDNTCTKLIDFGGAIDGYNPNGSLISDGTYLYGMTLGGGTNGMGTAFKIKISDNSYTKILDFAGTTNGSYPHGSLISDGIYLYGMTNLGGSNNMGTAFKIKISDNTYTKILDFTGTNGNQPLGSLISDGIYLYGMTSTGGANSIGTAFKIKISDNTYTKILDFAGTVNGRYPYGSLISDGTYLYGMTSQGGANGLGTLFKIKISDNTYTKLIDFAGAANGGNPQSTQLMINGSFLYGTTAYGGSTGNGVVFKYQIYYPDINIKQAATTIPNSTGTYDFGSINAGTPQTVTFTIENTGTDPLHLSGTPKVVVSGTGFTLASDAPATVNAAGTATFQVTFTPNAGGPFSGTISIVSDAPAKNPYNFAITGTGVKLSQSITFNALTAKTFGDAPFTVSATGGASGNPVTFTSQDNTIATCTGTNGSTVTIIKAGTVKIYANQAGNGSYNAATQAEQTFTINKATPVITWSNPADIVSGTALSSTQLNATAGVPGTFGYTPAAGVILSVGLNQSLSVLFTPNDAVNYNNASKSVLINVMTLTGIGDLQQNVVSVYPNPTNGTLTLTGLSSIATDNIVTLWISDNSGKTTLVKKLDKNITTVTVDVSQLANGVYFIILQTDKEKIVKRFVKQ